MIRRLRAADESAVRSLQAHLEYADPELVAAALDGPFLGVVAAEDGRVVGYAVALPGREVTLSELVVAPDRRRAGHGEALVEAVAARTGAERLVVTTPADDRAARRFYEAIGFAVEERIEGFYDADGDGDALGLVRRE